MKRTYRAYSDEDVIRLAKEVKSIAELLRALGLKEAGGNYINMKRTLQRLNIPTPHWTGQGWNVGKQLKDFSNYTRAHRAKKYIIKERGHKCEECGISKWRGDHITLEMDHIDGDRTNNIPDNWKLLCPNCHSQTSTWRNRGKGYSPLID